MKTVPRSEWMKAENPKTAKRVKRALTTVVALISGHVLANWKRQYSSIIVSRYLLLDYKGRCPLKFRESLLKERVVLRHPYRPFSREQRRLGSLCGIRSPPEDYRLWRKRRRQGGRRRGRAEWHRAARIATSEGTTPCMRAQNTTEDDENEEH